MQCLSDSYWGAYFLNQQNSTSSPNHIGTVIEFDIIDVNNMNIYLTGNSDYYYALSTTGHYKITVDSNNIKVFKQTDGVYTQLDSKTTSNYISDYFKIKFTKKGNANYIKYANFMIYSL